MYIFFRRIFDIDSGNCISTIDFSSPPNSIEISHDDQASLLITYGKNVEIYDGNTYVKFRFFIFKIFFNLF